MKIVIIDCESTGLSEIDQVVELAAMTLERVASGDPKLLAQFETEGKGARDIGSWQVTHASTQLVRPTVPVSVEARAVHHIDDAALAQAPDVPRLLADASTGGIVAAIRTADVVAAHNYAFDSRMMVQSGLGQILPMKSICTWRAALHLYPDAPGHSNQVLRYFLNIEAPKAFGMPPHRALPDAMTTANILRRMLEDNDVDELIDMTNRPVLLKTIRFGKYRGQLWSAMDPGYCSWILSKDFDEDVRYTARHYLDRSRVLGI